jgi:hypothetical protein
MAEEVTELSLAVDSTQVTRANSELDKFAATGLERGNRGA